MAIVRKQVQISMHPMDVERCQEFVRQFDRRVNRATQWHGGTLPARRSDAVNWLIKNQLDRWNREDKALAEKEGPVT